MKGLHLVSTERYNVATATVLCISSGRLTTFRNVLWRLCTLILQDFLSTAQFVTVELVEGFFPLPFQHFSAVLLYTQF